MTPQRLPDHLTQAFARQGKSCRHLGSPFTAKLCETIADRGLPDSRVRDVLESWVGDPTSDGDALPVRLCGALHQLVITGMDPVLASVYPPHHEAVDAQPLHAAIAGAAQRHASFMTACLQRAPQTNEIRRAAALYCGLMHISALSGKPVILSEICASAGLNLQLDRFAYRLGNKAFGDSGSPVVLQPDWHGKPPPRAEITIHERRGCDLHPFDLQKPDHRHRLMSYIWADQHERMENTRAAIGLAVDRPAPVDAAQAIDWLEARLAEPRPGKAHVVWHSIAWQYLGDRERNRGDQLFEQAGSRSSHDAPLFRLSMEGDGKQPGASLRFNSWPEGIEIQLGRVDFHGRWISWNTDYQLS